MMQFEIQDDKGVLFRGSPSEVMRIWDALSANKRKRSAEFAKTKHLIPFREWYGNLKIVSIIHELDCKAEVHTLE